ncbi:MAG: recombinase family protein [Alphaproteobacteria bacterium]
MEVIMKTVIYARFSSDKQSESSIDDQVRNCTRYAERCGMTLATQFDDKAISGTSKNRPGFEAMLAAAERREFKVLLVDDLSRLSRDDVEMKQVIRRFKFQGLRIVGVSDGYDSATKGEKIQSTMRGLMNEMYLDDLREKTHRGMYGKAMGGYSAGGRTYGYKRVPIEDPIRKDPNGRPEIIAVRREIDPDEAKWVQQMYEWFAGGDSPKRIADKLNRLGVSSTRGSTWAASAIYGDHNDGTGLLNNQLYIGRYIWNRSEWRKDPDTGKRRRTKREAKEWVITEMPELRIVPQPLWDVVQARHKEIRERSNQLREVMDNPRTRSHSGKYLFSGLIQCGCCGASYTVYSSTSYGCSTNINRGDAACSNRLRLSRKILEGSLLDIIRQDLLSDEAMEVFLSIITEDLQNRQNARKPDVDTQKRKAKEAEEQIANIMKAIQAGIITPTTKEALQNAEAEYARAKRELQANAKAAEIITTVLPRAVERYKALVAGLGQALYTDVTQARQCLKGLMGQIRLIPNSNEYLEAELRYNSENLFKLALGGSFKAGMVAGARFELTTFRL